MFSFIPNLRARLQPMKHLRSILLPDQTSVSTCAYSFHWWVWQEAYE